MVAEFAGCCDALIDWLFIRHAIFHKIGEIKLRLLLWFLWINGKRWKDETKNERVLESKLVYLFPFFVKALWCTLWMWSHCYDVLVVCNILNWEWIGHFHKLIGEFFMQFTSD